MRKGFVVGIWIAAIWTIRGAPAQAGQVATAKAPKETKETREAEARRRLTLVRLAEQCGRGALAWDGLLGSPVDIGPLLGRANETLVRSYYLCRAAATGNPTPCNEAQRVSNRQAEFCLMDWHNIVFLRQVLKSASAGEAVQSCLKSGPLPEGISQARKQAFCTILAPNFRGQAGVDAICEQLKAQGLQVVPPPGNCRNDLMPLEGKPQRCESISGEDTETRRYNCEQTAQLVSAWRSGDSAACQAAPVCRAQTSHNAAGCAGYAQKAVQVACENIAKEAAALRRVEAEDNARANLQAEEAVRGKLLGEKQRQLELEKRRQAEELKQKSKQRFQKGQAMQAIPPDVLRRMRQIEGAGHSTTTLRGSSSPDRPAQ